MNWPADGRRVRDVADKPELIAEPRTHGELLRSLREQEGEGATADVAGAPPPYAKPTQAITGPAAGEEGRAGWYEGWTEDVVNVRTFENGTWETYAYAGWMRPDRQRFVAINPETDEEVSFRPDESGFWTPVLHGGLGREGRRRVGWWRWRMASGCRPASRSSSCGTWRT